MVRQLNSRTGAANWNIRDNSDHVSLQSDEYKLKNVKLKIPCFYLIWEHVDFQKFWKEESEKCYFLIPISLQNM